MVSRVKAKLNPKQLDRFNKELRKPRKTYEHEKKYNWLSDLLDVYLITDIGTKVLIDSQSKEKGQVIACREGCHTCCLRHDVPVNIFEIMGLSWYISEVIDDSDIRNVLREQLLNYNIEKPCPFLIDRRCAVYKVRPIACRTYCVFGDPCSEDEEVWTTRPQDLLIQCRDISWLAAKKLLSLSGIYEEIKQREAFEAGWLFNNTKPLHDMNLSMLVESIDKFNPIS